MPESATTEVSTRFEGRVGTAPDTSGGATRAIAAFSRHSTRFDVSPARSARRMKRTVAHCFFVSSIRTGIEADLVPRETETDSPVGALLRHTAALGRGLASVFGSERPKMTMVTPEE